MSINSSIEWTDRTWNPTTGCSKISAGCKFCYALIMHARLKAMGQLKYKENFSKVVVHYASLLEPFTWPKKKNIRVFVNSMSDLFHEDVPVEFIQAVFDVMNMTPHIQYQVLTKRADRLFWLHKALTWTPNIWMGVSVEDDKVVKRIDYLRMTGAKIKFLSLEPLIGALPNLNLKNIDWVIVGGESGHTPRPMQKEWVVDILQQCEKKSVPFFFKQWGGKRKKTTGRVLNGRTYDAFPA